jgi:hypothetical protein
LLGKAATRQLVVDLREHFEDTDLAVEALLVRTRLSYPRRKNVSISPLPLTEMVPLGWKR